MRLMTQTPRTIREETQIRIVGQIDGADIYRITLRQPLTDKRGMNATKKFQLAVDGLLDTFHCCSDHFQASVAHPALQSAVLCTPMLQHPGISSITKKGIIKSVKECWRPQDRKMVKRRSSSSRGSVQAADEIMDRSVDLTGLTSRRNCHRLVVLGAPRVGKSNIIRRFLCEDFEEHYKPTAEDFYRKLFFIGGEAYQVDVLDAACERDFPAKRRLSILTGDIFLLVFSLDDRDSLNEIHELLAEIRAAKAKLLKSNHHRMVPAVVCGNKADLDAHRAVTRSDVTEILGEDVPFFEASAKTGTGLQGCFRALASLGGLPNETSPSRHQIVSILTYQSLCVDQRGRRRRRMHLREHAAPCAAVDPLARRPSFTSDLKLVLGSSTKQKKPEKCQIQ
uniref:Dexamethasone-induced Ras-related protein 1 n=1 Tax=Oryzias latipes TaxID=8090 RepID=A0A3P9JX98_ORYLA